MRRAYSRSCLALVISILAGLLPAHLTRAQCSDCLQFRYEGGDPARLCWTHVEDGVVGGSVLSDAGLTITSYLSLYGYEAERSAFQWADGCTMEARVRVPLGGISNSPELFRAQHISATDASGVQVTIWIWAIGVGLSTNHEALPGPGLFMMDFNAASAEHVYKVVSDASEVVLFIDGIERARLPYTTSHPSERNKVRFGNDSRYSGLAISEWRYVRFHASTSPEDTNACTGGEATFTASAQGPDVSYQWQWSLSPYTIWTDVEEGTNLDPFGRPIEFNAAGVVSRTLHVSDFRTSESSELYVRCLFERLCGADVSEPAILSICWGDYDCSGDVDVLDLLLFVDELSGCLGLPPPCGEAGDSDVNGDTTTDVLDFLDFIEAFGYGC